MFEGKKAAAARETCGRAEGALRFGVPLAGETVEKASRPAPSGGAPGRLHSWLAIQAPQGRSAAQAAPDDSSSTEDHPSMARAAAEHGVRGAGSSLPHLSTIQRSFGRHDVGAVRAHLGASAREAARALNARAFTTGEDVAFAGAPDLHTAAHEAAHTVQQRAGVSLKSEVSQPGDPWERHADAVAERVARGASAEALLDQVARTPRSPPSGRTVIQRLPEESDYGFFDTTKYDKLGPPNAQDGVDIVLTFDPKPDKVDATKIGLVQTVNSRLGGNTAVLFPGQRDRLVTSGAGQGSRIDQSAKNKNPMYAAVAGGGANAKLSDTPTSSQYGQYGYHYKETRSSIYSGVAPEEVKHEKAILKDDPSLPDRGNDSGQTFETAALAIEGKQSGTYMGSVEWGWNVDASGKFSQLPVKLKSKGLPTTGFREAAKQWNNTSTEGNIQTIADPTNVYQDNDTYTLAFTVPKDTLVEVRAAAAIKDNVTYDKVTIKSGEKLGQKGRIKVSDLKDTGGGSPVIKLPI
jgi:hypothetical protein